MKFGLLFVSLLFSTIALASADAYKFEDKYGDEVTITIEDITNTESEYSLKSLKDLEIRIKDQLDAIGRDGVSGVLMDEAGKHRDILDVFSVGNVDATIEKLSDNKYFMWRFMDYFANNCGGKEDLTNENGANASRCAIDTKDEDFEKYIQARAAIKYYQKRFGSCIGNMLKFQTLSTDVDMSEGYADTPFETAAGQTPFTFIIDGNMEHALGPKIEGSYIGDCVDIHLFDAPFVNQKLVDLLAADDDWVQSAKSQYTTFNLGRKITEEYLEFMPYTVKDVRMKSVVPINAGQPIYSTKDDILNMYKNYDVVVFEDWLASSDDFWLAVEQSMGGDFRDILSSEWYQKMINCFENTCSVTYQFNLRDFSHPSIVGSNWNNWSGAYNNYGFGFFEVDVDDQQGGENWRRLYAEGVSKVGENHLPVLSNERFNYISQNINGLNQMISICEDADSSLVGVDREFYNNNIDLNTNWVSEELYNIISDGSTSGKIINKENAYDEYVLANKNIRANPGFSVSFVKINESEVLLIYVNDVYSSGVGVEYLNGGYSVFENPSDDIFVNYSASGNISRENIWDELGGNHPINYGLSRGSTSSIFQCNNKKLEMRVYSPWKHIYRVLDVEYDLMISNNGLQITEAGKNFIEDESIMELLNIKSVNCSKGGAINKLFDEAILDPYMEVEGVPQISYIGGFEVVGVPQFSYIGDENIWFGEFRLSESTWEIMDLEFSGSFRYLDGPPSYIWDPIGTGASKEFVVPYKRDGENANYIENGKAFLNSEWVNHKLNVNYMCEIEYND